MLDQVFLRIGKASPICQRSATEARTFFLQTRRTFTSTSRRSVPPVSLDSNEAKNAQAYCSNLVRKYDSPSYTLSHFVQPHTIPAYLAIRAFNIEVSRIPDIVSNTTIGQMRMQFWRDTIDKTFQGNPPNEPVAVLLASYLKDTDIKLSKIWFLRIINARDQALTHPGFTNLSALETYAESTFSTLLYLTLSALPLKSLAVDHVASHVGKAAGITTILRGVPLLAFPPPPNTHSANPSGMGLPASRDRQRVINLPLDIMSQCGVREQDIYEKGSEAVGLRDAVFAIATRASDHLITARTLLKEIKSHQEPDHEFEHMYEEGHEYSKYDTGARQSNDKRSQEVEKGFGAVMGPAVSAQLWLDRLQKVDFDIFHESLRRTEWKLPAAAWWKNKRMEF